MASTTERLDIPIEGMTCASCAMRVERRLNDVEGVAATVNYATAHATVDYDPDSVGPAELLAAVESTGYHATAPPAGGHAGHVHGPTDDGALADLRRRLLVSALLAVPVVLISMVGALHFDGWRWVALALATPVVFWGGLPFHRATWLNLRHRAVTMDTLISLGTLTAWSWSAAVVLTGSAEDVYFEISAVVVVFLLTGRYLEARAARSAGGALRALLALGAKEAAVLAPDGSERRVPVAELAVDERFVVRPGERVATDGVIEQGSSALDTSMLTGESVPVDVAPGDGVAGATINLGGRLVVRATRVGSDTALARIAALVAEAQSGKAPIQRLADRVSAVFVPSVIVLALLTLAGWLLAGESAAFAISAAVAVLIIACPCALGLATPTALLVGTGRGAQLGVLIRGPEVLEDTRRVDTIVLDKTGTVTTGRMTVVDVVAADGVDRDELLRVAGAVEQASEHPIGRAIAAAAQAAGYAVPAVSDFAALAGLGVQGNIDGLAVLAGRPSLLTERGVELPSALAAARASAEAAGRTAIAVAWDGETRGLIVVADSVKPTSAQAVGELRALGLRPVLLTGDNARSAATVAAAVGIDEVIADVLPEQKDAVIRRLQSEGRVVAMVGDGVNDAPALARADLGIAMGTGTDAAIEASDLTLVRGDLRAAPDAIRLSRRTLRTIRQNLFWAFAYNVAALPLAALGLLNPMIAGAAMACSSLVVVGNALRLRRFTPAR